MTYEWIKILIAFVVIGYLIQFAIFAVDSSESYPLLKIKTKKQAIVWLLTPLICLIRVIYWTIGLFIEQFRKLK